MANPDPQPASSNPWAATPQRTTCRPGVRADHRTDDLDTVAPVRTMTPPRWRLFLLGSLALIGCYLLISGSAFAQLVICPAVTAAAGVALLVGSRSHVHSGGGPGR